MLLLRPAAPLYQRRSGGCDTNRAQTNNHPNKAKTTTSPSTTCIPRTMVVAVWRTCLETHAMVGWWLAHSRKWSSHGHILYLSVPNKDSAIPLGHTTLRLAAQWLPCWRRRRCFPWCSLSTSTPLLSTATLLLPHPIAAAAGRSERFYATHKSAANDACIHRATTLNTTGSTAVIVPPPPPPTAAPTAIKLVHDDYWVSSVASGRWRHDAAQRAVARRLQRLQVALQSYDNTPILQAHGDYLYQQEQQQQQQKSLSDAQPQPNLERQGRESDHQKLSTTNVPDSSTTATSGTLEPPRSASMPLPSSTAMRIPKGLYLHGSVGTGKSMLVDAFFACCVAVDTTCSGGGRGGVHAKQRRYHYHEFLHDIHERLHAMSLQQKQRQSDRNLSRLGLILSGICSSDYGSYLHDF
jgi:AFG1-like ATPase